MKEKILTGMDFCAAVAVTCTKPRGSVGALLLTIRLQIRKLLPNRGINKKPKAANI